MLARVSGEPPKAPLDPRTPAFVLCVCAVAILVGTFSKNWATAARGISIGPTGAEACLSTICRDIPWRGVPTGIQLFATLTWLFGIAAAAACAAFGGLFLADKTEKLFSAKSGLLVLVATAGVMTVFEIRMLVESFGPSWGVIPAVGGAIAGVVMLRKLAPHLARRAVVAEVAPVISPTLPTGPQQGPPPSCPRCGTRLSYMSDKQRWFCVRDQEYI